MQKSQGLFLDFPTCESLVYYFFALMSCVIRRAPAPTTSTAPQAGPSAMRPAVLTSSRKNTNPRCLRGAALTLLMEPGMAVATSRAVPTCPAVVFSATFWFFRPAFSRSLNTCTKSLGAPGAGAAKNPADSYPQQRVPQVRPVPQWLPRRPARSWARRPGRRGP